MMQCKVVVVAVALLLLILVVVTAASQVASPSGALGSWLWNIKPLHMPAWLIGGA
jgi:hypothetical protein